MPAESPLTLAQSQRAPCQPRPGSKDLTLVEAGRVLHLRTWCGPGLGQAPPTYSVTCSSSSAMVTSNKDGSSHPL